MVALLTLGYQTSSFIPTVTWANSLVPVCVCVRVIVCEWLSHDSFLRDTLLEFPHYIYKQI